jgi:hypothetical protein
MQNVQYTGRDLLLLWILPSEMDLTKSGLIREAWRFSEKLVRPHPVRVLYDSAPLLQLLAIRILIANAGMKFIAP